MYEALSIAATGLTNQQRRLDTIADNMANANTDGFKASRLEFKDALYTTGLTPAATRLPNGNQQQGHGVMINSVMKNFSAGNITTTGNELDFAIEGDGFFAFEDKTGRTVYSKGGNFYSGMNEEGRFLVNSSGYYVLDENGSRIQIPDGTESIELSLSGEVVFSGVNQQSTVKLGIYTFTNLNGLETAGSGNYVESISSGERIEATGVKTVQGALESSNVDIGVEMTRLVRAQRAFSLASRALTTADEMEGIANNMRR